MKKPAPPAIKPAHTKAALLAAIQADHDKLLSLVDSLTAAQLEQPGVIVDWSVKDILAHLAAWHGRLIQRVRGEPEGGADEKTSAFNQQVYQANAGRPLTAVRADFDASYQQVLALAHSLSPSKVQTWWPAFALNIHNHYRWASAPIRKWLKAQPK